MNPKVLIVEDDKYLVEAYKAKFAKAGIEVIVASDGDMALNLLANDKPDLVLLDLIMPRLDGFAFLERIKKIPKIKDIPVLVSSNLSQKESVAKAMEMGAADYVIKTDMSLDDLAEKIKSLIKN